MFDNFNEDDFLRDLNEAIAQQEKELLNINFEDKRMIDSDSKADYFCKVVSNLRKQKETKNKFIDEELKRIINLYEQYRTKENLDIDRKINFFEQALKTYTLEQLEGSNKKSIKLPHGTLSIKKQQDKYEYNDELVMNWLKSNNYNEFINTKIVESVDKKILKKEADVVNNSLILNGVEIEGVSVIQQKDKFEIK